MPLHNHLCCSHVSLLMARLPTALMPEKNGECKGEKKKGSEFTIASQSRTPTRRYRADVSGASVRQKLDSRPWLVNKKKWGKKNVKRRERESERMEAATDSIT